MTLRRPLSIALTTVVLALAACGDDDDDGGGFVYTDDGRLQVMTRNLYLGADLTPVLVATDLPSTLAATTEVWDAVRNANDFRVRAEALADEIATARPDLVGLQEVSLWRTQPPPADGLATRATSVAFDFLSILRSELASRGVPYDVAAQVDLFDFEAPVLIGTTAADTMDVRLTDRQVILKIQGLPVDPDPVGTVFTTLLPIPVFDPINGSTILRVQRGFTKVNATVGGQKVAFYNTHLEAFEPTVRALQAAELRDALDAEPLTSVVVVGDLNSDPDGPEPAAYAAVRGLDFDDLVVSLTSVAPTCCFDPDLTVSSDDGLVQRIDHILWRTGTLTASEAEHVGENLADRRGTPPRWPSDHVGVVGTFDP
jgi:endonuclease/exonuclease/phosphatase family metal-dependent hydrolase